MLQEGIAVKNNVIVFDFQATNITDAVGTASTLQATTTSYVMPWKGSIVGISAGLNGALTTGTLTFRPTINGTASTVLTTALSSTAQRNSARVASFVIPFAAGAYLGMDWTKSGTVDPETTDGAFCLFVVFHDMEF